MTQEEIRARAIEKAESFGFKEKKDETTKGNAIFRNNLEDPKGANYFGFIRPEEAYSGAYSDFSLVVFTQKATDSFFVCLGVGSQGFTNDYDLAALPGLRRRFLRLLSDDGTSFCKTDFADTDNLSKDFSDFVSEKCPEFKPVVEKYGKCLPAIRQLNSKDPTDMAVLAAWIAMYAWIRGWATNDKQRKAIDDALKGFDRRACNDDKEIISSLLEKRKYVVLQGAPGTGKTYVSNRIAEDYDHVFFTQFHAETSYSDFVCGLEPDIDKRGEFKLKKGVLYEAVEKARKNQEKSVLLIIDEINRANLSNVLGPVFYLFENVMEKRPAKVTLGDLVLEKLPDNLHVLATMNTADRSIAVVDFALRRRFAWYTLHPRVLNHEELPKGKKFEEELFNRIAEIFDRYATDEELNLQPGHSYFITDDSSADDSKKEKIVYELMPLIKEYLNEGYLANARESFSNLFYKEVKLQLFE